MTTAMMTNTKGPTIGRLHRDMVMVSTLSHAALMLYGALWHDHKRMPRYTDIDYWVFWDAAVGIIEGQPAGPYADPVYRYTPLLAWLFVPFVWIARKAPWIAPIAELGGKTLFSAGDLLLGRATLAFLEASEGLGIGWKSSLAGYLVYCNPMLLAISTRGNAEGLIMAGAVSWAYFVSCRMNLASSRHLIAAGVGLGLLAHIKIFPAIYGMPIAVYLLRNRQEYRALVFFAVSAGTFVGSAICVYLWYGHAGVSASLLYHLTRRDLRHNFAPHFYPFFLQSGKDDSSGLLMRILGMVSFLPQAASVASLAWKLGGKRSQWPLAFFLQTLAFVSFNKVSTSQYFVWYLAWVPIVIPLVDVLIKEWIAMLGAWLACGYGIEYGDNPEWTRRAFFGAWLSGILFLAVNVGIVVFVLRRRRLLE